jgi:O-antigen/teichoic acid export membrane protein
MVRMLRTGTVPALLISVGTMTANLLGYGFFLVLNRTQTSENLGALVALTNLAVIGAVPALALQLVVARRVARARAADGDQASAGGTALRTGTVVGGAMILLTCVLAPIVIWGLHLDGPTPALLLALVVGPTCLTYAVLGDLQGTDRFLALAGLYVTVGLSRLLAGVLAGLAGWGVTGVMAAIAAAAIVAALVAMLVVGAPAAREALRRGPSWHRPVLHGMTATSALLVVSSLDAPLARHFLDPVAAGEFAVLTIFSKAALWAPAFVVTVVYSRMATRRGSRHVGLAVTATAAIVALGILLTMLLRQPLALLVGGSSYAHLAGLVPLFTAIGGMWALAQVFVYWRLARADHRFGLLLWVVAIAVIVTVAVARHDSAAQLAWTLFGGGCAVVLVGATLLAVAMRRHRAGDLLVSGLMPGSTDPDADIERDVHPGR